MAVTDAQHQALLQMVVALTKKLRAQGLLSPQELAAAKRLAVQAGWPVPYTPGTTDLDSGADPFS